MKAFVRNMKRPCHVSHRGGSLLAPENTLAAFRQAVERYSTDQLEMDVHMSRDGVVFVCHDGTVERTTDGQGAIADMTAAEIERLDAGYRFSPDDGKTFPFRGQGVKVPRYEDVLSTMVLPIMTEVKPSTDDCRQAVADIVRRTGAVDRVCLGAWNDDDAMKLAHVLPEVALAFPEQAARALVMAAMMGQPAPESPFDVLALPDRVGPLELSSPQIVQTARAAQIPIQLWTVNDPETMHKLLDAGIDGIQTDRPDLLRQVLDARAQPT